MINNNQLKVLTNEYLNSSNSNIFSLLVDWLEKNKKEGLLLERYYCALLAYASSDNTNPKFLYDFGMFCKRYDITDENTTLEYIEKAALSKFGPALNYLADYYERISKEKSVKYLLECLDCPEVEQDKVNRKLGEWYYITDDLERAVKYLKIAADQYNDAYAKYLLACIYFNGEGSYKNEEKALEYCRSSANSGCSEAQYWLGKDYYIANEFQLETDLEMAKHYLTLACNQGHKRAAYFLGLMYFFGEGVSKDYTVAMHYLKLAENSGIEDIGAYMGQIHYEEGQYIIAEYELSNAFFNQGVLMCGSTLAEIYREGLAGVKDIAKAVRCCEILIDNKYAEEKDAIFVADSYYFGDGVTRNIDKAVDYYRMVENSNAYAKFQLGLIAYHELSTVLRKNDCIRYLESAGYKGYAVAFNLLAQYFESLKNWDRALDFYKRAFEMGDADSGCSAGRIIENGTATKQKNLAEAREWYQKSADAGSEKGREELKHIKSTIFGLRRI